MKKPKRIVSKILKILKHIAKNHGRRNENVKEDNEYFMVRELIEALGKIAYVVSWNVRSVCFAFVEGPRPVPESTQNCGVCLICNLR